jgi:hypothetical protein
MAKNSNHQWTAEHDRRLVELHAAGKARTSIAAALKRSVKSITGRLYILDKAKTAKIRTGSTERSLHLR